MKSVTILAALLVSGVALGGVLPSPLSGSVLPSPLPGSEMEGGLGSPVVLHGCVHNHCAHAITGKVTKPALTVRQSDCSSFLRITVVPPTSTIISTVVATVTSAARLDRRQQTIDPSNVPAYASACMNAAQYSSACSCLGITATTVTVATPLVTTTFTRTTTVAPPQVTHTGILEVTNTNGGVLGYVGKDYVVPGYMFIRPSASALTVTFTAPATATSVSSVELTMTNSNNLYPFLGLVQGRDNIGSTEEPGSYNYLYVSGTAHTPPGSTPQDVGTTFASNDGRSHTSESSVWNINLSTGAMNATWINPDGTPALNLQLFTQSNGLYAGSDPAAFFARYPAPVTIVNYTFIES